ncbi:universal stress protein [Desulfoplanes sp.]
METKKVLIAVDSSRNSERAVSYVGEMLGEKKDVRVCLLYVEKPPNRDMYAHEKEWKRAALEKEERLRAFLRQTRETLEECGIAGERISEEYVVSCQSAIHETVDYCTPGTSIADEILRVQRDGGYGTIVIGRRGVTKKEEFLFGSVSSSVMRNAGDVTLWVVE